MPVSVRVAYTARASRPIQDDGWQPESAPSTYIRGQRGLGHRRLAQSKWGPLIRLIQLKWHQPQQARHINELATKNSIYQGLG